MKRFSLLLLFTVIIAYSLSLSSSVGASSESGISTATPKPETRCGWFVNPTPDNAWLIDREGEWTYTIQGGYQADGDYPDFSHSPWIKTNGMYGYGCACANVTVDKGEMRIVKAISGTGKPLSACRNDPKLRGKEPKAE